MCKKKQTNRDNAYPKILRRCRVMFSLSCDVAAFVKSFRSHSSSCSLYICLKQKEIGFKKETLFSCTNLWTCSHKSERGFCQCEKRFLHIDLVQPAHLEERTAKYFCKSLTLKTADLYGVVLYCWCYYYIVRCGAVCRVVCVVCGVVWCGVVWCGVVWCGVVWCGVLYCGVLCVVVVVWCGVCCLPCTDLPLSSFYITFVSCCEKPKVSRLSDQDFTSTHLLIQRASSPRPSH